ncbi:hypothetical protein D3C72_2014480 [compost metagenome]
MALHHGGDEAGGCIGPAAAGTARAAGTAPAERVQQFRPVQFGKGVRQLVQPPIRGPTELLGDRIANAAPLDVAQQPAQPRTPCAETLSIQLLLNDVLGLILPLAVVQIVPPFDLAGFAVDALFDPEPASRALIT